MRKYLHCQQKTITLYAITFSIILSCFAHAEAQSNIDNERDQYIEIRRIPPTESTERNRGSEASKIGQSFCEREWMGYPAYYHLNYPVIGDEYFAVYQDLEYPECENAYPFKVTTVNWYFYASDTITLDIQPVIFSASGDECKIPSEILCTGPIHTIVIPTTGMQLITLSFSEPCCVDESYFAAVYLPEQEIDERMYPVHDDPQYYLTIPCASYNDRGEGWFDVTNQALWGNMNLWSGGYSSDDNDCSLSDNIDQFIPLCQICGDDPDENFGFSVTWLGDLNGDGYNEYAVGSPSGYDLSATMTGKVTVYWGGSCGDIVQIFYGDDEGDEFGYRVANAGDKNNDGKDDIIIGGRLVDVGGTEGAGKIYVYSILDGTLLSEKWGSYYNGQLGNDVTGKGDANNDGRDDFAAVVYRLNIVRVYSGLTGSELWSYTGTGGENFTALDFIGDVNGDNCDDLVVGGHSGGGSQHGHIIVLSGLDGSVLMDDFGEAQDQCGGNVSRIGDINGDGVPDFVVGCAEGGLGAGNYGSGYIRVYSGATLSEIKQLRGFSIGDNLGMSVTGGVDVNKDNLPDIVGGAPSRDVDGVERAGQILSFDYITGLPNCISAPIVGANFKDNLGFKDIDSRGNFDDSPEYEVLAGAPNFDPDGRVDAGCAFIFGWSEGFSCSTEENVPGDANNSGTINILDITYIINYLYQGGPAPIPYEIYSGDANCSCVVNILDITNLISFLYIGGTICSCDDWITACGSPPR